MNRRIAATTLVLVFAVLNTANLGAAQLTAIYYADSRQNNTLSLFYQSVELPGKFQFWGFTDFDSPQHDDERQYDLSAFFTEARLTHPLRQGFSIQAEYNDAPGLDNNVLRLGVVYKVPIARHLLLLRAFPIESDGDGGQLSAVWRVQLPVQRLFLEGFADYNFAEVDNRLVCEPQLRYMVGKRLGVTVEYRLNQFIRGPGRDDSGLALGLAYTF